VVDGQLDDSVGIDQLNTHGSPYFANYWDLDNKGAIGVIA
jgi:hypothetical protein